MYIESVPNRDSPTAILLRESYREGGKVKKRTLLNLSDWPPESRRFSGYRLAGGQRPVSQDCVHHHAVPANRRGFRVDRNTRSSGGLVTRSVVCEPNSDCAPAFCA